jgi:tRNA modification GTPase
MDSSAEAGFLRDVGTRPVVIVRTKADLVSVNGGTAVAPPMDPGRGGHVAGELDVSVVTGHGLGALKELLPTLVYGGLVRGRTDVPVLTRARHSGAVRRALEEVTAFVTAVEAGVPAELAATHLRPAETALEELLGVISPDEVLDRLFREFCIGK